MGGQLSVTLGTAEIYGEVQNDDGATMTFGGGTATVFHDDVTNDGVMLRDPNASVQFLENLVFGTTSSLFMTLGEDDNGRIDVAGTATLPGPCKLE